MVDHGLLDRLAGRQLGLLTIRQLLTAGMTEQQVKRAVAIGWLIPVRQGVYRVSGAPVTHAQALLAAVLGSSHDAVVGDLSAAALFGVLGAPPPDRIHLVTTALQRPRLQGVKGHRTIYLPASHRTRVGQVPITTPARTLVDICGHIPQSHLAEAADDLRRRKLLTLSSLACTFAEVPVSGRRKSVPIARYLHHPEVHPGGSKMELDVIRSIREAGLPVPEQQWKVMLPTGRRAFLDFAYPEILEALEFLGFDPHGRFVTRFHADAARTRLLQQMGWKIWPITAWTTVEELVAVARGIANRLEAHRLSLSA